MPASLNPIHELLSLHAAGRFADMENRARAMLKKEPRSAVLNEMAGISLSAQQRHADALPFLQKAVRHDPGDGQFWENLALCELFLGRPADAEKSLRRSLQIRPQSPDTLNVLGSTLRTLKKPAEAQGFFERALQLQPRHAGACFNLGQTLLERGEWAPAELALRRAVDLAPDRPAPPAVLAQLLLQLGRRDEAARMADLSFRLFEPVEKTVSADNIDLLDSLAIVFHRSGRAGEALRICKATYAFSPTPLRALPTNLIAREACDWAFAAELEPVARGLIDSDAGIEHTSPWLTFSLQDITPAEQLKFTKRFAESFLKANPPVDLPAQKRPPHDRLRIGYFSADFYNHPTSVLISGVIEQHDRSRFEIVAYDFSPPDRDDYRTRLEAAFDRMVPIRDLTDAAAARRIAEDEVDILIDLNGWTLANRAAVLTSRPAPVQIQWLCYAGSLGAPWIDYIVADQVLIPSEDFKNFSEKVIRLPGSYQPNDDKRMVGAAGPRIDHGLPESALVFCCFNQSFKITPDVFDEWVRLLAAIEDSVLWLLKPDGDAQRLLRARVAAAGVAPERLIFAPKVPTEEHLARLAHADLALDCRPYGSHTTASDALYAGVPLAALKGDLFASRVSASIMTAAGYPELIATSLADHYDLVLRLASDRAALSALKADLAKKVRQSPLFDTLRFTRQLEAAFTAVWERHRQGLPPDHIDID